jgi:tetratricopeptide (TPR) repeat protein
MKLVHSAQSKIGRNDPCHCGSGQKYKKCCWEVDQTKAHAEHIASVDRAEESLGPATRMEMQAMMKQIGKIIQSKGMSIDEANAYFTGRHMDDIASEYHTVHERTPQEIAEDMALEAHSLRTPNQRILAAQKAIEIDPNCAEAYLILADDFAENPLDEIEYYEKAISAAQKTLGANFFKENKGHFWGMFETRPLMRAKQFLAQTLWSVHRQTDAIQILWELLDLNPNDNQGNRYILFDWLLADNRLKEIEQVLKMFPEDAAANWEYNKLLFYFKKWGPESEKTRKQAQIALETNAHVVKYLTGQAKIPKEIPSHYAWGSKEEALCYAQDSIVGWMNTPNALSWLVSLNLKSEKPKAKRKK